MLNALRARAGRDGDSREEGFTLIELMIVVLIIGILLAIAIPTFLGARDRANNRSVQSNLRNALTAEKTLFTDNEKYVDTASAAASLTLVEPSLKWETAPVADIGAVSSVISANSTSLILGTKSATGECFYIGDVGIPAIGNVAGTFYYSSKSCTAPALSSLPTTTAPAAGTVTDGTTAAWFAAFGS